MNKYYQFGKEKLGPLLLGYSKWLYDNFRKEHIDKVYFFSRDGYLMKQAFDLMFAHDCRDIETYYLEVSRRSLRVPILWKDYSLENLLTMLSPSILIPIASIFDAVGLSASDYQDLLQKYGFDLDSTIYRKDILVNQNLVEMYSELSPTIEAVSLQEFENLKTYLRDVRIGGKFAIVDIGWSGGMQRFLQTTLDELCINADIYGYYTGVASYFTRNLAASHIQPNMRGYLFDFMHNPNDTDCRNCFVGLYEMLFGETKGSVEKYEVKQDGKVFAKRYPYEYCVNGQFLPEIDAIKEVQRGAIDYVVENRGMDKVNSDKLTQCQALLREGQNPSAETLKLFADFRFFDEGEYYYLARPKSLFHYAFHPSELKRDFLKSRWKTGFLKRLMALPLPYYSIYKTLKKHS